MGNKRPRQDEESSGYPAEKRQKFNKPNGPHGKPHHKKHKKDVDLESMNAIKKRARAIERLLARDDAKDHDSKLPASKRVELERELAAHKQRIQDAQYKKERSKMIKKYHMVRFFERKKAMRFVKQLERRIKETTDPTELAQFKADLHVAQVDIDYAKYFPFMEPYVSLYAGVAHEPKEEETAAFARYLRTPRPPMWKVIEETRKEGEAALERLQNRPPQKAAEKDQKPAKEGKADKKSSDEKKKKKKEKEKKKGPRQEQKERKASKEVQKEKEKRDESDSESEGGGSDAGGFFE